MCLVLGIRSSVGVLALPFRQTKPFQPSCHSRRSILGSIFTVFRNTTARNEKGAAYKCPITLVIFILLKDCKFDVTNCINLSCMWCGCRRADQVVSKAYPGMPRYVLAFVHLGQLSHLGNRNFV